MACVAVLIVLGLVALILFGDFWSPIETEKPEPIKLAQGPKVVEATENATELPDGTIIAVRKVRQWH